MTIFLKLPPNSGNFSITDKLFKTRRCPLLRSFTVVLFIWICKTKLVSQWKLKSTWPNTSQKFWKKAEHCNSLRFSSYCLHYYCVTTDSLTSLIALDFEPEIYRRKLTAFRRTKGYATINYLSTDVSFHCCFMLCLAARIMFSLSSILSGYIIFFTCVVNFVLFMYTYF